MTQLIELTEKSGQEKPLNNLRRIFEALKYNSSLSFQARRQRNCGNQPIQFTNQKV